MTAPKELFEHLHRQVYLLASRWAVYCQLFDSGPDSIQLLNTSGRGVFALLQQLILDDAILSLCRLTDPPASGGGKDKQNASIRQLVDLAEGYQPGIKDEITPAVAALDMHVANIRVHRSKSLAHSDIQHAFEIEQLPGISYDELEGAMKECKSLLTRLGEVWGYQVVNGYNPVFAFGADGNALLAYLRKNTF